MTGLAADRRVARAAGAWFLIAAVAVPAGAAHGGPQSRSSVARQQRPAPGTPVVVTFGDSPVVAWVGAGSDQRIRASGESMGSPQPIGPAGPGSDGLPAAASSGSRGWIVAARSRGEGSALWARAISGGTWEPTLTVPRARRWNHHPAAAASPGALWVVWVAEDDDDPRPALYASHFDGSRWAAPEPVPPAPGQPMAPAIALDAQDNPAVVWAASDGTDAEIWWSHRNDGGWASPRPLSENSRPDLFPHVGSVGDRVVVAWATGDRDGYTIQARHQIAPGIWGPASRLSPEPGLHPRVVATDDGAVHVVWNGQRETGGHTLRSSTLTSSGWSSAIDLAAADASPPAATAAPGGRVLVAWTGPEGDLAVRRFAYGPAREGGRQRSATVATQSHPAVPQPLAGPELSPARATLSPAVAGSGAVPRRFSAFGDSITNGVLVDPERRSTVGYRGPLRRSLVSTFGTPMAVFNRGMDGEVTADGIGRIDNVVRGDLPDAVLVLEGTNDVVQLVDTAIVADNLERIVERVFEEKPDTVVFLGMVPPQNRPGDGFGGPFNRRVDEVNSHLPDVAAATGAVLVDLHTPFVDHPELFSDSLHPSEDGYMVMGEAWFGEIRPYAITCTNRGDVDGSGRVDGVDLVLLALAFGSNANANDPRYVPEADINQDGRVDGFDLALLAEFFGQILDSPGGGS